MNKFGSLDGRHKLAILGALICWVLSVYFSYLGFKVDNSSMVWIGWVMAGVVTIVELAFNTPMHKLPLTLAVIGLVCYAYGVFTNITGFWSLQHPGVPFVWFQTSSLMPIIIGFVMEVLPEPLFMWGLDVKVGGDLLGNIAGLWGGTLKPQSPDTGSNRQEQHKYQVPQQIKSAHVQSQPVGYNRPAPKPQPVSNAGRPNPTYHQVTRKEDLFPEDD
jgi:hypothetical protein